MAQIIYPDSDIVVTNWTSSVGGSATFADINDQSDIDYIYTTVTTTTARFGLSKALNPIGYRVTGAFTSFRAEHTHNILCRAEDSGLGSCSFQIALYENGTQIAISGTINTTSSFAQYSYSLSTTETNNISDWGNLEMRIIPTSVTGQLRISGLWMAVEEPFTFLWGRSDVTINNWTTRLGLTTNLYGEIDADDADDANYVVNTGIAVSGEVYEVKLFPAKDPARVSGTENHNVFVRLWRNNTDVEFNVRLMQGGTTIMSQTIITPSVSTWTNYMYTLSSGQANSITDYTDLRIRIEYTNNTLNSGREGRCSIAGMYLPQVGKPFFLS